MDKIDIKLYEDEDMDIQIMRCMAGINELVEGYEKIMKRLDRIDKYIIIEFIEDEDKIEEDNDLHTYER